MSWPTTTSAQIIKNSQTQPTNNHPNHAQQSQNPAPTQQPLPPNQRQERRRAHRAAIRRRIRTSPSPRPKLLRRLNKRASITIFECGYVICQRYFDGDIDEDEIEGRVFWSIFIVDEWAGFE